MCTAQIFCARYIRLSIFRSFSAPNLKSKYHEVKNDENTFLYFNHHKSIKTTIQHSRHNSIFNVKIMIGMVSKNLKNLTSFEK